MNFYASPAWQAAAAEAFFFGREARTRDYLLDGRVYRLLEIEGRPVLRLPFLDYHEPLEAADRPAPSAHLRWIPNAVRELVPLSNGAQQPSAADGVIPAPTVRWGDFASFDAYLELLRARSAHQLRQDRRRLRHLEALFEDLSFAFDDPGDDVLPFCFERKSAQSVAAGGQDLFAHPSRRRYFHVLRDRGLLRCSTLRGDGRLLAASLGTDHGNALHGWITAYDPDPDVARLSPGRQLLMRLLAHSHAAGHRELDFSVGDETYKWFYATHAREVGPVGRPGLGARVGDLLLETAKDVVRTSPWLEARAREMRSRLRELR